MGCFEDGMKNICEPYGGNMPLFNSPTTDATVTIVSEAYDDGMKITKIQTPPRTETRSLIDAIDSILGLVSDLDIGVKDGKCPVCGKDPCVCEGDKNDEVQSKRKQAGKQDGQPSDDKLQKPRGFGSALSESGMAQKD